MWLTSSSIGRKLVMAITGAALILFVTFHVVMNSVAIFWPSAYNVICAFLGANWYALVGTVGLAALFIIHIIYAVWLTLQNRKARGNDRYDVVKKPKQVEWSSQNMLVLGIVILAFLVVHLIQFWAKMQLAEIRHELYVDANLGGLPPQAGTLFIQLAFGEWWTLLVYCIGFIALWFHMTHGFWSMFQSAGWNNDIWINRLKCIGNWWTTLVVALFIAEAVVFTVQAHKGEYLKNPALQQQYIEMALEHQNALVPGVDACGAPAGCPFEGVKPDCGKHHKHCDGVKPCGKHAEGAACPDCEQGAACPDCENQEGCTAVEGVVDETVVVIE